jgi:hypothetical protein
MHTAIRKQTAREVYKKSERKIAGTTATKRKKE